MDTPLRPCPTCHGETAPHVIESMRGEELPLAVTVRGMTVMRCADEHTHFVSIDFPLKVLNHLVEEDEATLPAGRKKGFIFKHFHCRECDHELAPKADHRHAFSAEVDIGIVTPFSVEFDMPVYKCPACGTEQLHSLDDIREHTPMALANAFRDAGIAREA